MDRKTLVTLPDGSEMQTEFIEDEQYKTVVTDPEGNKKISYRNIRENIVLIEQFNQGNKITTEYEYNPMGEILKVIDDQGNVTSMTYDKLGRRTSLDNPNNGLIEYSFDLAGNMLERVDNNLREKGQSIKYEYDYNRLIKIDYPESRDVEYFYGEAGAEANRAGRMTKAIDESGSTEYFYGKLGEEIKTIKIMNSLVKSHQPETHTSEAGYDYLGISILMERK